MLLNNVQRTGQPSTTKNHQVQDVLGTEVEEPGRRPFSSYCLISDSPTRPRATLLKVRDVVSSHVEHVLQIYEQHADTIGLDAVLQASAASPSVAEMLEWLQDIERHYRNSYPLHTFRRAVPGSLVNFSFHWITQKYIV